MQSVGISNDSDRRHRHSYFDDYRMQKSNKKIKNLHAQLAVLNIIDLQSCQIMCLV